MKRRLCLYIALCGLLLGGCAAKLAPPPLAEALAQYASTGPLAFDEGRLITDNDKAFAEKLRLVESARQSVDLAYYIFSDDYSSSRLSQALIDAANRGVRVRLLLDYFSAYKDLDRLSWLEQQGAGMLEVRLYNRPTLEIVKDAAFLTLSCADVGVAGNACDEAKLAAVARHFEADRTAGLGFSNRSLAGSGLFLSGLYGKHPKLMAYAVTRGQAIDTQALAAGAAQDGGERTEQLKSLGRIYFKARYMGGVDGVAAKFKLAIVRLAFAEQVNPVFDTVSAYLPLSRKDNAQAQKDWDYLTEFLHHKFLLADGRALMLGGRNVEDSYHMRPGPLADKYIFMDTDVRLALSRPDQSLAGSFDRLWQLGGMVATLEEVRQHAPNDLLANFAVLDAAQEACDKGRDEACVERYLDRHFVPLGRRIEALAERHRERLERYSTDYRPEQGEAALPIDQGARISYLENLPIAEGRRSYGADHGREAAAGKNIHALWRSALHEMCAGDAPSSREVFFHNAYLFMPASLLEDLAGMLDGSRQCAGVRVSLLTNSLATTDLNIVNLLAVWQLKALADHLGEKGPAAGAATLRYFEYRPVAGAQLSLHSKVMLFGDDLFIGSANADVRSLMMDSNNGLFIRGAGTLASTYRRHLESLLSSPDRVADQTAMIGRDASELRVEMDRLIDQLLDRYAGPERLSGEQRADLKGRIEAASRRVYTLSREIMRGSREASDAFNALFKAI